MEKRSCFLAGEALSFAKYEVYSHSFACNVKSGQAAVRVTVAPGNKTLWVISQATARSYLRRMCSWNVPEKVSVQNVEMKVGAALIEQLGADYAEMNAPGSRGAKQG
jgi:hypothetical protein